MGVDVATLAIAVELKNGQLVTRQLTELEKAAGAAEHKASDLTHTIKELAAAFAAMKLVEWAHHTSELSARYETLGVVMDVVGRNAGKSAGEMANLQASLQKTGISMIESRNNLARMVSAQIDLTNATKLARIAQDAAVIGNLNSSEAFEQLVTGISTGQTRILRTLGIFVDLNEAHKKYAATLHKNADDLTELERAQANANAVMASGERIAGAYEAAMGTAGKQMKSAERYAEDLRVKIGEVFAHEHTTAVFAYANALKWMGNNIPAVVGGLGAIAAGIVAVTVAAKGSAIASWISSLPLATISLAAAAIGVLAYDIGLLAQNFALARQEAADNEEVLKHLSRAALERGITESQREKEEIQAKGRTGVMTDALAKRYAELDERIAKYKKALEEMPPAQKKVAEGASAMTDETLKTLAAQQGELDKLRALNEAYGASDLALKKLEIRLETAAKQREFIVGHSSAEIAAYNAVTDAIRDQEIIAARNADTMKRYGEIVVTQLNPGLIPTSRYIKNIAEAQQFLNKVVGDLKPRALPGGEAAFIAGQKYKADMEAIWAQGIAKIVTDGTKSFRDFFEDVLRMFTRMLARMEQAGKDSGLGYKVLGLAAAGIGAGVAGYQIGQQSGSALGGFLGGAAGGAAAGSAFGLPGAVIGGLVGAAAGLFGAANAHKEAAEQLRKAAEAFQVKENTYVAGARGDTMAATLANLRAEMETLLAQAREIYRNPQDYATHAQRIQGAERDREAKIADDFWKSIAHDLNELNGPAGQYANAIQAINDAHTRAQQSAIALGASTEQLSQIEELYIKQLTQLAAAKEQERARTEEDAKLRLLKATNPAAYDDAAIAAEHRREIEDLLARGVDEATIAIIKQAQAAEDLARAADKAAEAQRAAAAAQQAQLEAAREQEDLAVRLLRAQGKTMEADDKAFAERQRREYEDAVSAKKSQEFLDLLRKVQEEEARQRVAGLAGTDAAGVFNGGQQIVTRNMSISATSDQATAMLDRMQTQVVIQREMLVNLRVIAVNTGNLGENVNGYLGRTAQSNNATNGTAMVS